MNVSTRLAFTKLIGHLNNAFGIAARLTAYHCPSKSLGLTNCRKNLQFVIPRKNLTTTLNVWFEFETPDPSKVNDRGKKKLHRDIEELSKTQETTPNQSPIEIKEKNNKYFPSIIKTRNKRYSEEEDKLIVSYVEKHGYSDTAFKLANEKLNRSRWHFVKQRYDRLTAEEQEPCKENVLLNNKIKRTRYSKEEDLIISNHVEKFGYFPETFKALCRVLNRPRWDGIQQRYDTFTSNVTMHEEKNKELEKLKVIRRKRFSINEDNLINEYLNNYGYNTETLKKISEMLSRSVNVVHNRIHSLKSNVDKIPDQRKEWSLQEDKALMKYMIKVRPIIYQIFTSYSKQLRRGNFTDVYSFHFIAGKIKW